MTISPISGSALSILRKSARLTRTTRLFVPVRADTRICRSLNRSSSPVNWRSPCTVKYFWLACSVDFEDLDAAVEHEKEINAALATLEQHRSFAQSLLDAVVCDPIGGVDAQAWKRLRFTRVRIARINFSSVRTDKGSNRTQLAYATQCGRSIECTRWPHASTPLDQRWCLARLRQASDGTDALCGGRGTCDYRRGQSGVARSINSPSDPALVVAGAILALVPGLPRIALPPDLVLLVFLPPLIYYAAFGMSWQAFCDNLRRDIACSPSDAWCSRRLSSRLPRIG